MAAFHSDAHLTDAFDSDAFFLVDAVGAVFPGTIPSDGGKMWPPRAGDPRWTQLLTDTGITQTGNFTDDVKTALVSEVGQRGHIDGLWKRFKILNGKTDISEPFTY